MAKGRIIKARKAVVTFSEGTSKSDIARRLLDEGLTVSEISKIVPMAYSQVHSIAAKRIKAKPTVKPQLASKGLAPRSTYEAWGELPPTGRPSCPLSKRVKVSPRARLPAR